MNDYLEQLLANATPGPWRWLGNRKLGMYLATVGGGRRFVMDFVRQGMRGAQPRFQVYNERGDEMWEWNGLMTPASELAVLEVPYREDIVDIDNADARLIALAPDMARLLIDMGEQWRRLIELYDGEGWETVQALLARLDSLGNP